MMTPRARNAICTARSHSRVHRPRSPRCPAKPDCVRPSDFVNATALLTGSEALTLSAVAAMISKYLGWEAHPLQIAAVSREAYVEYQLERRAHSQSNPPTREFLE